MSPQLTLATNDVAARTRNVSPRGNVLRKHAVAALGLALFIAGFDTLMNLPLWPATQEGRASGLEWFGYNLVIVPSFFLSLFVAALAAERATERGVRYVVAWTIAVVAGCVFATALQWSILEYVFDWNVFETSHARNPLTATYYVLMSGIDKAIWTRQQPVWILLTWSIPTTLATILYAHWRRAAQVRDRLYASEVARAETERQVLEVQLRATQARVEPQFLFDTLARVKALQTSSPGRAAAQLDGLIAYLRAALPRADDTHSTLTQELELCRAYVEIEKAARNDDCSFVVESPEGLANVSLPAIVLLPLVARAVAIADSSSGLSLRLRIALDRDHLRIELDNASVASEAPSALPGEVRERLVALYRNRAQARVEQRDDRTGVTLELPLGPAAWVDDSPRATRRSS